MADGTEELTQRGYIDDSELIAKLTPEDFGEYGKLSLGSTTLNTLQNYLDLSLADADEFEPQYWKKPTKIENAKPDTLIVKGESVIAVIEHKTNIDLGPGKERRRHLEQLQTYVLACSAKLGILTDGKEQYLWVHNLDPRRRTEIKLVKEDGSLYRRFVEDAEAITETLEKLNLQTDQIAQRVAFDPSLVAKSIWQDVYVATRQDPEKCFQTFVELFMYKLMSDFNLLPKKLQLDKLTDDPKKFKTEHGDTQIEYYFNNIRERVKKDLFEPMNTDDSLSGLVREEGKYQTTAQLLPSIDVKGGKTSVIDGHAFQIQPRDYNSAFVRILRKLESLPPIQKLDPGFKSRVYEQFLRRDPNTSKVTGKYFTSRNIVKAIVQMAEVSNLQQDARVCDPSAGVGGFLTESILELQHKKIRNFRENDDGKINVERKFVGLEVLEDVVSLAKANLLLHCFEFYTDLTKAGRKNFCQLMADIFVHCHEDRTLGTLKHPTEETFDLIMANPPYMVSGTGNVTQKIKEADLTDFYDAGGTGLESRFFNWIVKSLRRGGRAFAVLPKSMLARVNNKFKCWIRERCYIDAVVYLPENSFYTTPNPTYILAITRKHDDDDEQQDPVFCYYVRDIGETRDTYRNPARNDLVEMADEFRTFKTKRANYVPTNDFCKIVDISKFSSKNRWDMDFLWSPQELANLGVVDTNVRPADAIIEELDETTEEIQTARAFINTLVTDVENFEPVKVSDKGFLSIHRGTRVTQAKCEEHPGDIPVVASGRYENSYLGTISEEYLQEQGHSVFGKSDRIMTVGCTGAVGVVHMRREEKWFLHDDALAIEVIHDGLLPEYVRYALQRSIDKARFGYLAKLYQERLKALTIEIPLDGTGSFDLEMQERIAKAYQREEEINSRLQRLAEHLQSVSIEFGNSEE